jgi:hypothetical protein
MNSATIFTRKTVYVAFERYSKAVHSHAMKAYGRGGSQVIVPLILNLGINGWRVADIALRPLYLREGTTGIH